MITLDTLNNITKDRKSRQRVGRGTASKGKTCGRGIKGAGARSGYKRRASYEGGQARIFEKMPTRGFSRAAFQKRLDTINLGQIDQLFNDGDEVNLATLKEKGFFSGPSNGLKVLGDGELTKKVTIHADAISATAKAKCEAAGTSVVLPE